MRIPSQPVQRPAASIRRLELVLPDRDGEGWSLTLSPEMMRLIGAYPRLPGMARIGEMLDYRATA